MTTTKEYPIEANFKPPAPPTFFKGKFKGTNSLGIDCYSADWYSTKEVENYIENVEMLVESYEKKLAEKDTITETAINTLNAQILTLMGRLSEANARNAMLVEALTEMQEQLQAACKKLGGSVLTAEFDMLNFDISTNSEAVAAWKAEKHAKWNEESNSLIGMQDIQITNLRREVARMQYALRLVYVSPENDFQTEEEMDIIKNTRDSSQATAEAYEREVEARGAVKALDDEYKEMSRLDLNETSFQINRRIALSILSNILMISFSNNTDGKEVMESATEEGNSDERKL